MEWHCSAVAWRKGMNNFTVECACIPSNLNPVSPADIHFGAPTRPRRETGPGGPDGRQCVRGTAKCPIIKTISFQNFEGMPRYLSRPPMEGWRGGVVKLPLLALRDTTRDTTLLVPHACAGRDVGGEWGREDEHIKGYYNLSIIRPKLFESRVLSKSAVFKSTSPVFGVVTWYEQSIAPPSFLERVQGGT